VSKKHCADYCEICSLRGGLHRARTVLWGWIAATLVVVLFALPASAQTDVTNVDTLSDALGCPGTTVTPAAVGTDAVERAILCLVNGYRRANNRKPLHTSSVLRRSARSHAHTMIAYQFFGHIDPNGRGLTSRLRASHYLRRDSRFWSVAENLATDGDDLATARHVVGEWMRSVEHRSNLLRSALRDVGIAVVPGAPGTVGLNPYTVVMDLGVRR